MPCPGRAGQQTDRGQRRDKDKKVGESNHHVAHMHIGSERGFPEALTLAGGSVGSNSFDRGRRSKAGRLLSARRSNEFDPTGAATLAVRRQQTEEKDESTH